MRMTISEFLEHVDGALPRGRYRLTAEPQAPKRSTEDERPRRAQLSPGYVVVATDSRTGARYQFLVSRDELGTDARGEWQASVVARTIKELSRTMSERGLTRQTSTV